MSTTDSSGVSQTPARSNFTLWLILAVCLLPFVASVALYLFWRPESFVNYGELLEPAPLATATVGEENGGRFRFDELHGKWVMMMVDQASCGEHCRKKLYWMRQVRLAQGPDQDRIERLWLVNDGKVPAASLLAEHAGLRVVAADDARFLQRLPTPTNVTDHLYLIDPFGNLMMRYPHDLDPGLMKKDLSKLLRISKGWRQLPR